MPAKDYTRSAYSDAANYEKNAKEILKRLNIE